MKNNIALLVIVGVIIILGVMSFAVSKMNDAEYVDIGNVNDGSPQACTEEAKICPDGSAVGRTGPNCEFAKCPAVVTPAPTNPGPDEGGNDGGIGDGSTPPPSSKGKACEAQGGTWNATYRECGGVRKTQCEAIGGNYNECASACRHMPEGTMCTLQCVEICEVP